MGDSLAVSLASTSGRDSLAAMKVLALVLVVALSLGLVLGKKNGKLKYDKDGMEDCRTELDALQPKIDKLREELELVRKCLKTEPGDPNYLTYCVGPPEESSRVGEVASPKDRSTAATTADTFARCGPQTITGWTNSLDIYYTTAATTDSANVYVSTGSGTYTAPVTGYYNICAFLRFKRGGNAVDVTVVAGGSTVAGFGD